jgi:hypothetical protein
MPIKLSFADYLAVAGFVATIILVVLDKAGRLKGPMLLVLIAIAALLTLPLLLGIDWVADAEGSAKFVRVLLMVSFGQFRGGVLFADSCLGISHQRHKRSCEQRTAVCNRRSSWNDSRNC